MATYAELLTASENATLRKLVKVGCFIAAETVRTELVSVTNHVNRLKWAKNVYVNVDYYAERMLWTVLAQNSGATLAQILAATDAQVQTAVNAAVDVFADGT